MILVTGANGMIGGAVARLFAEQGQALRLHTRSVLDLEMADQSDFDQLVSGCSGIIHAAALVHNANASEEKFEQLNVRATSCLAKAASKHGVENFVFLSTSAVYGSAFEGVNEGSPLLPGTPYARSKLACEQLLAEQLSGLRLVILRPSLVFGEGDRGNMLSLIRQIEKGMYVNVSPNPARKSVVYAADVAHASFVCLSALPVGPHILNVANPQSVGIVELSAMIAACLGKRAPAVVPANLLNAAARVAQLVLGKRAPLTTDRLKKLTSSTTLSVERLVNIGFQPQFELSDALKAEIAWSHSR